MIDVTILSIQAAVRAIEQAKALGYESLGLNTDCQVLLKGK